MSCGHIINYIKMRQQHSTVTRHDFDTQWETVSALCLRRVCVYSIFLDRKKSVDFTRGPVLVPGCCGSFKILFLT